MPILPPGRHVPSSAIASFIDRARIDRLLTPFVPEAADRAFVVRCLLDEGPAHHRGANFILLALLEELLGGAVDPPAGNSGVAVPMRLPPHLQKAGDDGTFPLRFPSAPIERLAAAGSPSYQAMIDCLTDGPPQHSLANAAMVCLLDVLLERSRSGKP